MTSLAVCTDWKSRRNMNQGTRVYSLPVELLSYIFILGQTQATIESDLTEQSDESEAQLCPFEVLITHVSFYFRDTAIETPMLWSNIDTASALSNEALQTYLVRAKRCELSVSLNTGGARVPSVVVMKKIDLILPHLHRYQRLVVDIIVEPSSQPLIRRFKDAFAPTLRYISISVEDVENYIPSESKIFQGGAPLLTTVRLQGLALLFFRPPLENVTTLHLDHMSTQLRYITFVDIVSAPFSLQNLSVCGDFIDSSNGSDIQDWPGAGSPINLPHLRSLRICGINGKIYSGLLLGITSPVLDSLVLMDLKEPDLEGFWASPMHTAKFPILQSLSIIDPEISRDACLEMFRGFPYITSMTTSDCTSTIAYALSEVSLDNVPWPVLDTLTMNIEHYDDELAADIVEQRMTLGCPLRKLNLGTTLPLFLLPNYAWLQENVVLGRVPHVMDGCSPM
ncbi:hypothetical protein C0991_011425 [Blastosporella zonata]|nr:hypothetical protein C0991_011425 [Blastosporella zonata]